MNDFSITDKPFNIELHSKSFKGWCELVIWPDGKIEYAVPSHIEKLINGYCEKTGLNHEVIREMLRVSQDSPYYRRLLEATGMLFVWYDSVYSATKLTSAQHKSLTSLLLHGCISDKAVCDINYV